MLFATIADVKARSSFKEEMASLSDDEITSYINRADRWIYRTTKVDYSGETDAGILEDLKTATVHLVDLIWLQDNPDTKENAISGLLTEKVGSYSYNRQALPGDSTGIPELDSILEDLTPEIASVSYFSVGGPSS